MWTRWQQCPRPRRWPSSESWHGIAIQASPDIDRTVINRFLAAGPDTTGISAAGTIATGPATTATFPPRSRIRSSSHAISRTTSSILRSLLTPAPMKANSAAGPPPIPRSSRDSLFRTLRIPSIPTTTRSPGRRSRISRTVAVGWAGSISLMTMHPSMRWPVIRTHFPPKRTSVG